MSYSTPKGEARLAVEEALKRGTINNPIDAVQVAGIARVDITVARTHISNTVNKGLAYNVGTPKGGKYVWGPRPNVPKMPEIRPRFREGTYDGSDLRPFTARQGAMDAYRLFSIHAGEQVERKAPYLMGSKVAVGVRV